MKLPTYQLTAPEIGVIRRHNPDGSISSIPTNPENSDYQQYLKDAEAGAEVLDAAPIPDHPA